MADDLRTRLEGHAKAFEGMMSLIPADFYYGKDNSDQWQRKKQTPEERRAAKKAKLDPQNYKTALDVHKENEKKRKRESGGEAGEPDIVSEQPKEGLKRLEKQAKKQKLDHDKSKKSSQKPKKELSAEENEAIRKEKAEKRRIKRERKNLRNQNKREQKEARKTQKKEQASGKSTQHKSTRPQSIKTERAADEIAEDGEEDDSDRDDASEASERPQTNGHQADEADDQSDSAEDEAESDDELDFPAELATAQLDTTTGISVLQGDFDSSDAGSEPDTPTFDMAELASLASSSSSVVPPSEPETSAPILKTKKTEQNSLAESNHEPDQNSPPTTTITQKPLPQSELTAVNGTTDRTEKFPKLSEADAARVKERLDARLAALRAARKADGPDGKPARNRQDMIEARRQKQERRKQHKKELRQKAKQDQSAEDEAARLRGGSGSPMWSPNAILSPREPSENFSFGKVAFGDERDEANGGSKKKGPQDVKTALEAAKKKQQRLSGFDQDKRTDIEERDRWLTAKKRVQGEKLRDNTSLLKKTLKRKEKGKAKSEKEWDDRKQGVQAGIEAKQRKREDNLKKRKEDKGSKKGGSKPVSKPKKRPGFEGTWKSGGKGGRSS